MKKIILLLFSLLLYFSSFAQPYKSYFGEEYTKWYVYYPGWEYFTSAAYLSCCNRSEVIDTFTYQCLFQLGYYDKDNTTVPQNANCRYYFREDRNTGQLFFRYYYWNNEMSQEMIVSDMSLQIGDSVPLYSQSNNYVLFDWQNIVVIDENRAYAIVDSVYYLDELKHIRTSAKFLNYEAGKYDTLMFVETFGSNFSPFLDLNPSSLVHSYAPIYTCYETESELVHLRNDYETCFLYYIGIKVEKKYQGIRMEINNGLLSLFFEESFSGQINLFDLFGRALYQKNISNQTNHNIDVSRFQKGIYILSLRNDNNEFLNKKIVIF